MMMTNLWRDGHVGVLGLVVCVASCLTACMTVNSVYAQDLMAKDDVVKAVPAATASAASSAMNDKRVAALLAKTKADMIFVKGGTFKMGDFGRIHAKEKMSYSGQTAAMPLHEVALDSFSLGRYKVTYEDFDVFTDATGRERVAKKGSVEEDLHRVPNVPAGVSWPQAKDYCQWIGKLTSTSFDLPTEAQYEYAARNRGKFVLWPTNNGQFEKGKNLASYEQREEIMAATHLPFNSMVYPIGCFPPTPMGFYDMGSNGWDWLNDWFDEDYYEHSPSHNPQGPETGTEKAQRGIDGGAAYTALTMYRHKSKPDMGETNFFSGFRCAVNALKPIKH